MDTDILQSKTPASPLDGKGTYGLVLSGGGMRFAIHAGIMLEMSRWVENGNPWLDKFSVLVGTSAGALYAGLYAVGYSPAQIAAFALLFANRKFKDPLFDWNYSGLASAFLHHDFSYLQGAVGGNGVLSLVETLTARGMPEKLAAIYPSPDLNNIDVDALKQVEQLLFREWHKRKRLRDRTDYYKDLLTFADCKKKLYLLGVNALTGQKTVFGKILETKVKCDELDRKMCDALALVYMNPPAEWQRELDEVTKELGLPKRLEMHRYENRLYHEFDDKLYSQTERDGAQLPVALAIRASVSLPGFFEPARIQRLDKIPGSNTHEQDVFLDGGVDDNFSLSVAADEYLGNCRHILGISLSNLGYRFPDPNALKNVAMILLNTTNYLGEAILDLQLDFQQVNSATEKRSITILNALPSIGADITDTEKMGDLINEARKMVKEFWEDAHRCDGPGEVYGMAKEHWKEAQQPGKVAEVRGTMQEYGGDARSDEKGESPEYPTDGTVQVDLERVIPPTAGIRIWCSKTARSGTESFKHLKKGANRPSDPKPTDTFVDVPRVFADALRDNLARVWVAGYIVLSLVSFGVFSLLSDLWVSFTGGGPVTLWLTLPFIPVAWQGLVWRILGVIVVIFGLRFFAYSVVSRQSAQNVARA